MVPIVAMPLLDLVVGATWISLLTAGILIQAFTGWLRYREAARSATQAARLAEVTRPRPERHGRILQLRSLPAPTSPRESSERHGAIHSAPAPSHGEG